MRPQIKTKEEFNNYKNRNKGDFTGCKISFGNFDGLDLSGCVFYTESTKKNTTVVADTTTTTSTRQSEGNNTTTAESRLLPARASQGYGSTDNNPRHSARVSKTRHENPIRDDTELGATNKPPTETNTALTWDDDAVIVAPTKHAIFGEPVKFSSPKQAKQLRESLPESLTPEIIQAMFPEGYENDGGILTRVDLDDCFNTAKPMGPTKLERMLSNLVCDVPGVTAMHQVKKYHEKFVSHTLYTAKNGTCVLNIETSLLIEGHKYTAGISGIYFSQLKEVIQGVKNSLSAENQRLNLIQIPIAIAMNGREHFVALQITFDSNGAVFAQIIDSTGNPSGMNALKKQVETLLKEISHTVKEVAVIQTGVQPTMPVNISPSAAFSNNYADTVVTSDKFCAAYALASMHAGMMSTFSGDNVVSVTQPDDVKKLMTAEHVRVQQLGGGYIENHCRTMRTNEHTKQPTAQALLKETIEEMVKLSLPVGSTSSSASSSAQENKFVTIIRETLTASLQAGLSSNYRVYAAEIRQRLLDEKDEEKLLVLAKRIAQDILSSGLMQHKVEVGTASGNAIKVANPLIKLLLNNLLKAHYVQNAEHPNQSFELNELIKISGLVEKRDNKECDNEEVVVYSIDADGCFLGSLSPKESMNVKGSEVRNVDYLLKKNKQLLDQIKKDALEGKKVIVMVGSNRQNLGTELNNACTTNNRPRSGFINILLPQVINKIINDEPDFATREILRKNLCFDPALSADIANKSNFGTEASRIREFADKKHTVNGKEITYHEHIMHDGTIMKFLHPVYAGYFYSNKNYQNDTKDKSDIADPSKFLMLYWQIHKIASENPSKKITYHFYDDHTIILNPLIQLFKKFPGLIPSNMTIQFHLYQHHQEQEKNLYSDAPEFTKETRAIKGKGKTDENFRKTTRELWGAANQNYQPGGDHAWAANYFFSKPGDLKRLTNYSEVQDEVTDNNQEKKEERVILLKNDSLEGFMENVASARVVYITNATDSVAVTPEQFNQAFLKKYED